MSDQKTHRVVNKPQISARFLADYMAASEKARRTIVRNCKYQAIARILQHDEAKLAVGKFIRGGGGEPSDLIQVVQQLRNRLADSDYDRTLYDTNADYIERFAQVYPKMTLPEAEIMAPGKKSPVTLNGVKVNPDISFYLQRVTRTNRVRAGAGTLRYAKGKPLRTETAKWQSAFLAGYLRKVIVDDTVEPELKLCVTVDAYAGICHPAPTDSIRRFQNMEAACATIAERWPNIEPPQKAVL